MPESLGSVSVAVTHVKSCDSPCTGAREGYDDGDTETERDGLDEYMTLLCSSV